MYYKGLHDTIFALYPFGPHNTKSWHLVLFNFWFSMPKALPMKFKTSFCYLPEHSSFCFDRYWGKPNRKNEFEDDIPYYFKCFNAPWAKFLYKKEYLHNGKWCKLELTSGDWTEQQEEEDKFKDHFTSTFKFFEDGKRVVVKADVTAEKLYYGIHWFPNWLKPLFNEVRERAWISFSTDIGKGRGTWKGGTVGRSFPFTKNLATTWLNFEYNELPKYLKGEK